MSYKAGWSIVKRVQAMLQALMRRHLWRMDIDPSAVVEPTAYVDRTWPKGVHIRESCYIGEHAVVLTHDMVRGLYLDTIIGARTTLGPRSIIMPGLEIGEDCEIAAGAVVIRNMPARARAVGNPAEIQPRN